MKHLPTYTGKHDHTYLEAVDIPFSFEHAQGRETDLVPAESIHFRLTYGNTDYGFYIAPHRRLIILLDGSLEVETGHGDKRQFRAGDMLEVTDTHGHGHISRAIDGRYFHSVFTNLDDELIAERRRQARSRYCAATPNRKAGRHSRTGSFRTSSKARVEK